MAYEEEIIVQEWLDHLKGLDVHVKKMFYRDKNGDS